MHLRTQARATQGRVRLAETPVDLLLAGVAVLREQPRQGVIHKAIHRKIFAMSMQEYTPPTEPPAIDAEVVPRWRVITQDIANQAKSYTRSGSRVVAREAERATEDVQGEVVRWVNRAPEKTRWKRWCALGCIPLVLLYALFGGSAWGDVVTLAVMVLLGAALILLRVRTRRAAIAQDVKTRSARSDASAMHTEQAENPAPVEDNKFVAPPAEDTEAAAPVPEPVNLGKSTGEDVFESVQEDIPESVPDLPSPAATLLAEEQEAVHVEPASFTPVQTDLDTEWLVQVLTRARALRGSQSIELDGPIAPDGPHARQVSFRIVGGTYKQMLPRRAEIAAELDIPEDWLDMEEGAAAGRMNLWWATKTPFALEESPLVRAPSWNIFQGAPFLRDKRARLHSIDLLETSMIFGGMQNFGKTSSMYTPVAAYVLDPRTDVWSFDFKGGSDWTPVEAVAARYGVGAEDETVDYFLSCLERLRDIIESRFGDLRSMDGSPKVTEEMVNSGEIRPILLNVDELEACFLVLSMRRVSKEEKEEGVLDGKELIQEITNTLALAIKRSRAAAIVVQFSGQRPAGKEVGTGLRDSAAQRICHHMATSDGSEMVLGDAQRAYGVSAAGLGAPGRAVFINPRKGALKGQTLYISRADFAAICERGAALRRGHHVPVTAESPSPLAPVAPLALEAPEEEPEEVVLPEGFSVDPHVVRSLLLGAMGTSDRLSTEQIREALTVLDPDTWGRRDDELEHRHVTRVGEMLTAAGVTVRNAVRFPGGRRQRGVLRQDLLPQADR